MALAERIATLAGPLGLQATLASAHRAIWERGRRRGHALVRRAPPGAVHGR